MYKNLLLNIILISKLLFAIYLLIILLSYDPYDLSWLYNTTQTKIHNFGGNNGALLADILFFTLGVVAYITPFIIMNLCWIIFYQYHNQKYINYFTISVKLIVIFIWIMSSCSLLYLFKINDIWYFASGGILGIAIIENTKQYLDLHSYILMLIFLWITGFYLYFGKPLIQFFKNLVFLIKRF